MKKLLLSISMMLLVLMTYAQLCPDGNHPHVIDLGLPSGTLWACCNVGADKPEAYGVYYSWGETEEKSTYTEMTYQYCTGEDTDGEVQSQGKTRYVDNEYIMSFLKDIQYDKYVFFGERFYLLLQIADDIKEKRAKRALVERLR